MWLVSFIYGKGVERQSSNVCNFLPWIFLFFLLSFLIFFHLFCYWILFWLYAMYVIGIYTIHLWTCIQTLYTLIVTRCRLIHHLVISQQFMTFLGTFRFIERSWWVNFIYLLNLLYCVNKSLLYINLDIFSFRCDSYFLLWTIKTASEFQLKCFNVETLTHWLIEWVQIIIHNLNDSDAIAVERNDLIRIDNSWNVETINLNACAANGANRKPINNQWQSITTTCQEGKSLNRFGIVNTEFW